MREFASAYGPIDAWYKDPHSSRQKIYPFPTTPPPPKKIFHFFLLAHFVLLYLAIS